MESGAEGRLDAAAFLGAWRRFDADGKWGQHGGSWLRGAWVPVPVGAVQGSARAVGRRVRRAGCPSGTGCGSVQCGCLGCCAWGRVFADMSELHPHKVLQVFSSLPLPPYHEYRSCKSPFSPQKFCLFITSVFHLLFSLLVPVCGFIFVSEKFSVRKTPKLCPALTEK